MESKEEHFTAILKNTYFFSPFKEGDLLDVSVIYYSDRTVIRLYCKALDQGSMYAISGVWDTREHFRVIPTDGNEKVYQVLFGNGGKSYGRPT